MEGLNAPIICSDRTCQCAEILPRRKKRRDSDEEEKCASAPLCSLKNNSSSIPLVIVMQSSQQSRGKMKCCMGLSPPCCRNSSEGVFWAVFCVEAGSSAQGLRLNSFHNAAGRATVCGLSGKTVAEEIMTRPNTWLESGR